LYQLTLDVHVLSLSRDAIHRYLLSFPTRRSSDLDALGEPVERAGTERAGTEWAGTEWASAGCAAAERAGAARSGTGRAGVGRARSEEHTSELQSRENLVCRLLLEKKKR